MKTTIRLVPVLALAVALCIPAMSTPASAAAATTAAAAHTNVQTQTFSGGSGSGQEYRYPQSANPLQLNGLYSTKSQLGVGFWRFDQSSGAPRFARFVRSVDGMTLVGTNQLTPHACGAMPPNTTCLTLDLDGTADIAHAHLIIAKQVDAHLIVAFLMSGTLTLNRRTGYAIVDANGRTFTSGGIEHIGDAPTTGASDIELTPSRQGYWIVNRAGQVYAFGNARYLGNANRSTFVRGEVVSSITATPTGRGYLLFTSRGRVIPFGDAAFFGDMHDRPFTGRIVAAVATPTGRGYYMTATDGGVFNFGDARFRGSLGNVQLNRPIVAMVLSPDASGYWLFGADGGVFAFHAHFFGAFGGSFLFHQTITAAGPGEAAYRSVTNDGEVFQWKPVGVLDFEGNRHLSTPIVGVASTV